jgi:hypothetical protein
MQSSQSAELDRLGRLEVTLGRPTPTGYSEPSSQSRAETVPVRTAYWRGCCVFAELELFPQRGMRPRRPFLDTSGLPRLNGRRKSKRGVQIGRSATHPLGSVFCWPARSTFLSGPVPMSAFFSPWAVSPRLGVSLLCLRMTGFWLLIDGRLVRLRLVLMQS